MPRPTHIKNGLMNISAFSMQGRRTHMEDYFDIGYQLKPDDQQRQCEWPYEYFYFGIFDGHGGHEAAKFAKANLLKFITKQSDFWSNDDKDVLRAIQKGYADTHSAMKQCMPSWSRTSKVLPSTAGTTASVLFIRNGKFYTGHVGDSRIVISKENPETKQWISQQLTEDHKPESKSETERIERAGGEVKSKIGVHRVVWKRPVLNKEIDKKLNAWPRSSDDPEYVECLTKLETYPVAETIVDSYQTIPFLAIARSLGDFWSLNPYTGLYVVSPEPDVACRPISPDDKCILLATDGLWNVMNSSQATRALQELKVVKKGMRNSEPFCHQYFTTDNFYDVSSTNRKNHALSLVYMAYQIWERRRLRSDNITAVVAMIGDILSPLNVAHQASPNKSYSTRASNKLQHQIEAKNNSTTTELMGSNPVQIEQTHLYCEKIRLNKIPYLKALPNNNDELDFLQKLENYLVFPPTILEQELMFSYGMIEPPKNYLRLSHARLKKLKRNDSWPDSFIYIKRVSDDPDDRKYTEARTNDAGKRVRDSSAQATQTIHDFGQPWDQLKSEEECREFEEDVELVFNWELLEDDIVVDDYLDCCEEYKDDTFMILGDPGDHSNDDEEDGQLNEDDELVGVEEDEDCNDSIDYNQNDNSPELDNGNNSIKSNLIKCSVNELETNESSIPKLRCLMNYNGGETPILRRSTRSGNYLSVTENSKRKNQPSAVMSKTKRRKSHPVPCAVAQA